MMSAAILSLTLLATLGLPQEATSQLVPRRNSIQQAQQQQPQPQQAFRYGAVVDCGSSGTRAHIFRWPAARQGNYQRQQDEQDLADNIEQLRDPQSGRPIIKRIRPGLASLYDDPDTASDYMQPVMDFISQNVPLEAQNSTKIWFLGTAGLRLLEPAAQKRILDDLARDLPRNYPNFERTNLFTRVISGIEEGFYQWLSVNTFARRLGSPYDPVAELQCQAPRSRRYGLIEMGGASVQISYELTDQVDSLLRRQLLAQPSALRAYLESQVEFQLSSSGKKKRIFSATFLGFGSNNARNLATALLVRELGSRMLAAAQRNSPPATFYGGPNSTLLIQDPCLPIGSTEQPTHRFSLESLFDQTRSIGLSEDEHSPSMADTSNDKRQQDSSFSVRLYGGGSFVQCQRLLSRVLVAAKRELTGCNPAQHDEPCTTHLLGTKFVPFRLFQMLGLGDMYYTTDLVLHESGQFGLAPVLRKLVRICSLPYRQLLTLHPEANRVDAARVRQECFKASWMLTLLQQAFQMPAGADFRTVGEINGQALDWTTGAIIVRLADSSNHLDRVHRS